MANSALLVIDVQRDVLAVADDGPGYLPRLRRRSTEPGLPAPAIYVVMGLRPGDPGVSPRNEVMTNIVRLQDPLRRRLV